MKGYGAHTWGAFENSTSTTSTTAAPTFNTVKPRSTLDNGMKFSFSPSYIAHKKQRLLSQHHFPKFKGLKNEMVQQYKLDLLSLSVTWSCSQPHMVKFLNFPKNSIWLWILFGKPSTLSNHWWTMLWSWTNLAATGRSLWSGKATNSSGTTDNLPRAWSEGAGTVTEGKIILSKQYINFLCDFHKK